MHDDRENRDYEYVTSEFHARERESEMAAEKMFRERGYSDPSDFLNDAGEALYGVAWKAELSRDLEISDRTIRNWLARKSPVPEGVQRDLLALLEARSAEIERVRGGGKLMIKNNRKENTMADITRYIVVETNSTALYGAFSAPASASVDEIGKAAIESLDEPVIDSMKNPIFDSSFGQRSVDRHPGLYVYEVPADLPAYDADKVSAGDVSGDGIFRDFRDWNVAGAIVEAGEDENDDA